MVLYGCEVWSLIVREEYILRMIKSRMRLAWHVAQMGEKWNACMLFVGKSEGKRPVRRPRWRWSDIEMDLRGIGWGGMDWIDLAQDRVWWTILVKKVMNLWIP
jgi:hypothetical protein